MNEVLLFSGAIIYCPLAIREIFILCAMTIETNSFMLKGTSRCVAVKTDEYKGKDC